MRAFCLVRGDEQLINQLSVKSRLEKAASHPCKPTRKWGTEWKWPLVSSALLRKSTLLSEALTHPHRTHIRPHVGAVTVLFGIGGILPHDVTLPPSLLDLSNNR